MKPITDVLRDIRKGMVAEAAGEELANVVRAVTATGKAGSLTLKLTVKPQKGDAEQVNTEAGTIAELAVRAKSAPEVVTAGGRTYVITPSDLAVKDVTNQNDLDALKPTRIRQAVTLQTVDSLVDYVD
ncbi:hypothetical protein LTR94_030539, partial [Friedmanniomyces endolithicus]